MSDLIQGDLRPEGSREKEMTRIKKEVSELTDSPLYDHRKSNGYYPVIGEGSLNADIVLIGEAPGRTEAETSRPFCGRAGKFLDQLLDSIGLDRESVYITNIIKDRPKENRDPSDREIAVYGPFLDRQIEIIQPKVIVTLGRFAAEYILTRYGLSSKWQSIGLIHGQCFSALTWYGSVTIIPLYHPAAAIYDQKLKQVQFSDIKILRSFISR